MDTKKQLIVFTAPSGAGKTTIVRYLLQEFEELSFSISATTRKPRSHEVPGKDYYFLSEAEFKKGILEGHFIEWEEVYQGTFYGTLKKEVERLWAEGKVVLFDIDVNGAMNLKKQFPDQCFVVFVEPPSFEVLVSRLTGRKTESEESLNKRINKLKLELAFKDQFDFCLLNDQLEETLADAKQLINQLIL